MVDKSRQVEVVENMQLGMVIAEDGPLEQSQQLERIFQRTCHPYSWLV